MYPDNFEIMCRMLSFALLGAVFGLAYEIIRAFRHFASCGKIRLNIEDCVFIVLCALVMFIVTLSTGDGQIRLYHVLGVLLGFSVYILTVGRLLNAVNKRIFGGLRRILIKMLRPIYKIVVKILQKCCSTVVCLYKLLSNRIKKSTSLLKSDHNIVYNNNYKSNLKRGELRSVVKAKIK